MIPVQFEQNFKTGGYISCQRQNRQDDRDDGQLTLPILIPGFHPQPQIQTDASMHPVQNQCYRLQHAQNRAGDP